MNPNNFDEGFFLMSRSVIDGAIFKKEKWLKFLIYCVAKAAYKKRSVIIQTGQHETVVDLERGQFVFGRKSAAKKLGVAESTARNLLEIFRKRQILDTKADTHYTVVTVVNYDAYQTQENYKGHQKGQAQDRHRTGTGHKQEGKEGIKENKYSAFFENLWKNHKRTGDDKIGTFKKFKACKKMFEMNDEQIRTAVFYIMEKQEKENTALYQLSNVLGQNYRQNLPEWLKYGELIQAKQYAKQYRIDAEIELMNSDPDKYL